MGNLIPVPERGEGNMGNIVEPLKKGLDPKILQDPITAVEKTHKGQDQHPGLRLLFSKVVDHHEINGHIGKDLTEKADPTRQAYRLVKRSNRYHKKDQNRKEEHGWFEGNVPAERHLDQPGTQKEKDKDLTQNHFGKGIGGEFKAEKERDENDEEEERPRMIQSKTDFFSGEALSISYLDSKGMKETNHQLSITNYQFINNQLRTNIQIPIAKPSKNNPGLGLTTRGALGHGLFVH